MYKKIKSIKNNEIDLKHNTKCLVDFEDGKKSIKIITNFIHEKTEYSHSISKT